MPTFRQACAGGEDADAAISLDAIASVRGPGQTAPTGVVATGNSVALGDGPIECALCCLRLVVEGLLIRKRAGHTVLPVRPVR